MTRTTSTRNIAGRAPHALIQVNATAAPPAFIARPDLSLNPPAADLLNAAQENPMAPPLQELIPKEVHDGLRAHRIVPIDVREPQAYAHLPTTTPDPNSGAVVDRKVTRASDAQR